MSESGMPVSVQDGRAVTVVLNPPGVPIGYHSARAVSLSGRSESMETSIGHRHEYCGLVNVLILIDAVQQPGEKNE